MFFVTCCLLSMITKKVKKDYSPKKYHNNLFNKKKRRREAKAIKLKITLFLSLAAAGVLIWFLFFSRFLMITDLTVNGEEGIIKENIQTAAQDQTQEKKFLVLSQKNIIIFDKSELSQKLNNSYFFEELTIKKKLWSRILEINFKRKNYSLVWQEGEYYYYINKEGEIISEANPLEIKGKNYPLIENAGESKISGKRVEEQSEAINFIADLFEKVNSREFLELNMEKFILNSAANTVKLKVTDGPELLFNSQEGIDSQLEKLKILVENKLKDDFMKKKYIDLRYGDTVYYQ